MDFQGYLQEGHRFRRAGALDEAIGAYSAAADIMPSHYLAPAQIGLTHALREDFDKAISYHQDSIALSSNSEKERSLAYYYFASTLAKQGKTQEAIEAYGVSAELQPSFAKALSEQAELLAKRDRLEDAVLLAQKAQAKDPDSGDIRWVYETLSTRATNAKALKNCSTKIVSLGSDCLPRTILTRWGIKPNRAQGELSCPFDLAGCTYSGVLKVLSDDFKDLVNPVYLKTVSNANVHFGIPMPTNDKYGLTFNHERGGYWTKSDFENLVARYKKRIENFYHYLESHPVLFVFHDWQGAFREEMSHLLNRKFGKYNYDLLVINTSGKKTQASLVPADRTTVLDIPLPSAEYQWSLAASYKSKKGVGFEREIQTKVKEALLAKDARNSVTGTRVAVSEFPLKPAAASKQTQVVFFGNCQAFALSTLLTSCLQDDSVTMEVVSNNARTGNFKSQEEILRKLACADVVIYQPLGEKHGELSERNLKKIAAPGATLVSFPYIFNSGMYSLGHAPMATTNEYGFIYGEDIIKALLRQHSLNEVLALYKNGLIDFKLTDRFEACVSELSRREKSTDVKVADFIRENFRRRKLFLTHNHPTTVFFKEVCRQIVQCIDLPFDLSKIDPTDENQAKLSQTNTPISLLDVEVHSYQFAPHYDWFTQGKVLISTIHKSVILKV